MRQGQACCGTLTFPEPCAWGTCNFGHDICLKVNRDCTAQGATLRPPITSNCLFLVTSPQWEGLILSFSVQLAAAALRCTRKPVFQHDAISCQHSATHCAFFAEQTTTASASIGASLTYLYCSEARHSSMAVDICAQQSAAHDCNCQQQTFDHALKPLCRCNRSAAYKHAAQPRGQSSSDAPNFLLNGPYLCLLVEVRYQQHTPLTAV